MTKKKNQDNSEERMWGKLLDLFTYKAMDLNSPKVKAWQEENSRLAREGYTLILNDDGEFKEKDGVTTPREPAPMRRYFKWVN